MMGSAGGFAGGGPGQAQVEEVLDDEDDEGVPDLVESFEGAAAQ